MDASHDRPNPSSADPAPVSDAAARAAAIVPNLFEYYGSGAAATVVDRALRAPGSPVRIDVVAGDDPQHGSYGRRWLVFDVPGAEDDEAPSLRWASGPADAQGTHAVIGSYQAIARDRAYLAASVVDHLRAEFRQRDAILRIDPGQEHLGAIPRAEQHPGPAAPAPANAPDPDKMARFQAAIRARILLDIAGRPKWRLIRSEEGYSLWRAADPHWNPAASYFAATPDGGRQCSEHLPDAERNLQRLKLARAIATEDGGTRPTV